MTKRMNERENTNNCIGTTPQRERGRETYTEEEEHKILDYILVRERLEARDWSVGGSSRPLLTIYLASPCACMTFSIFRKPRLDDNGEARCLARQVLAEHEGKISKSYSQVGIILER